MVHEVGPRVADTPAEAATAERIRAALVTAGWSPHDVGMPNNLVACRGAGERLLLAHIDTVPGSPGAIDNGAGVAVILELARTATAPDLCVGFPVAEELGLVGSRAMARAAAAGHPAFPGGMPALTVAIDLAGQGQLALMGLGPAWTPERLSWLQSNLDPLPVAPFAYRVYSRLLPWMERSDHAPFAWHGGLSLHLLGLGDSDVFPLYHQPEDVNWERKALIDLAVALHQLGTAPKLPPLPVADGLVDRTRSPEGAGLLLFGLAWPTELVWGVVIAGIVAGLADLRRGLPGVPRQLVVGLLAAVAAAGTMAIITGGGWFSPTVGERTAMAVMGTEATGWWSAAPVAVGAAAAVWLAIRHRLGRGGSASFGAALGAIGAAWLDPVFALPFGAAALLARLHPLFALIPAAYLLRPSALRQFTFHGLAPPLFWGAVWLLAWPAVAGWKSAATLGRRQTEVPCPSSSSSDPS
ncbi:MAG: hypothetical protein CL927_19580 [Deltaproteobacteria bacterium]|nr:hypothetical protein [Deltaproteobacteria bacterium]HCH65904.1 hypothetical protein [Deltaproteobacteria bacterium]